MIVIRVLILLCGLALAGTASAEVQCSNANNTQSLEAGPVQYLLDQIAHSEAVFIRNGKEYKTERALRHINAKYRHFQDQISSAEDFIRLTATRSELTGKPYSIRLPDAPTVPSAQWLSSLLEQYRAHCRAQTAQLDEAS